jgi:hypothetical protein
VLTQSANILCVRNVLRFPAYEIVFFLFQTFYFVIIAFYTNTHTHTHTHTQTRGTMSWLTFALLQDEMNEINAKATARASKSKKDPNYVDTVDEMTNQLELMHDRCVCVFNIFLILLSCIARNLRSAGLGSIDAIQEERIYGILNPDAKLRPTDEPLIFAVLNHIKDVAKRVINK